MYHLFFEQSGTFKNEFKKLGYDAIDYDISNTFGQTDKIMDLFKEIELAYEDKPSVFDSITENDTIMAFFPCIRFENQVILWFLGNNYSQRDWSDLKKLDYAMKLHNELNELYILVN